MEKITQSEFDKKYNEHIVWLETNGKEGTCADFSYLDLSEILFPNQANLKHAILVGTIICNNKLINPNFQRAILKYADLSRSEFQKGVFSYASLENAILTSVILKNSNFENSNLEKAILDNSDFQGSRFDNTNLHEASLKKANFIDAQMERVCLVAANLKDANFTNANLNKAILSAANQEGTIYDGASMYDIFIAGLLNPSNQKEQELLKNYENKISQLENERMNLTLDYENKSEELAKNKEKIDLLTKELYSKKAEIKNRLEESKINDLNKAFITIKNAGTDLDKEVSRLNYLFRGYVSGIIISFILAFLVWYRFIYYSSEINTIFNAWIYLSPSIILIGIIGICIFQAHKCQRQLISLRKFLYKTMQIKGILEAYVYIADNEIELKTKINKILDDFVNHIIDQDIDLDKEEEKIINTDKKETIVYKEAMNAIIDIAKSIK